MPAMGQHYVPQHYLRSFEVSDQPGVIWTYDKIAKTLKCLPIKSVAQESGYYEEADETALANQIEGPALHSLTTLRRRQHVDDDDRIQLSTYIASLIMRVPRRRAKAFEMFPDALQSTASRLREQFKQWAASSDADSAVVARGFAEIERAERKFAADPPSEVVKLIRSPWPSPRYVELLYSMTWRIIRSNSERFITSDNPAYFFSAYGIGSPETEVCCPLAPDVGLHMSRQGEPGDLLFIQGRRATVKEINRRVATGAERFVFSADPALWLRSVCDKPEPYLSRIQW